MIMKRTKSWGDKFTPQDRSFIIRFERGSNIHYGYGGGGYLPDDTTECGVCGSPCLSSPCSYCYDQYNRILLKTVEKVAR
jgi:hypothetical protein